MGYNSYYLYRKVIQIGDQPPVPFYPETYSVSGDNENPMPLVLKEENSVECGYTDIVYRWHQLPISTASECSAGTKYYVDIYQVSYDGGLSWEDVVPTTTRIGDVYETGSSDCIEYRWITKPITEDYICDTCPPVQPIYRTLTSATTCVGYDKHTLEEYQVSYDEGVTWTTTATSATTLIEANSEDCGYIPPASYKWLATYYGGTTSSANCDSTSAITQNEIETGNLQSVIIGTCVTHINYRAFYDGSIPAGIFTSVTIPNTVTSIGDEAFKQAGLTSVIIPNSVTSIGSYAFHVCQGLTSVTIGSGITSINEGVFQSCTSLASVNIPNTVNTIGTVAFENCPSLTGITIPNSVTTIGVWAFMNCSGLTSVVIPSSVTSIGNYAFAYCRSLTSVTIGSGVTGIDEGAFQYCSSLTSITINATTPPTLGSAAFGGTNNCPIYVPSSSVNAYKSATNWSNYANRIQAIP